MPDPYWELPKILLLLGNTADEVATSLKAQHIQGVRNTARFLNPVCRFVEAAFTLNPLDVQIIDHALVRIARTDGTQHEAPLPEPVKDFLEAFNRRAYPDLEVPTS